MKRLAFASLGLFCAAISLTTSVTALAIEAFNSDRRVSARASNSQPYPSFNSQRLDEQLIRYQRLLDESGPPNILIVGSSRALQGVDPVALELALAHYGYPGLKVYNFSINGATARVIDLVLRKILTPEQLPDIIIWADGVRAFNSGRVDRTYQAIVESEGYKLLSSGISPLQTTQAPPAESAPTEATTTPTGPPRTVPRRSPMAVPKSEVVDFPQLSANEDPREAIAASYQAMSVWFDRVRGEIANTYERETQQAMWIRRREPTSPTDPAQSPNAPPSIPGTGRPVLPSGGSDRPPLPTIAQVMAGETPNQMQPTGFVPVSDRYDPNAYYQTYPKVPGQYDGDYAAFNLQGDQKAALEAVASFARSQQIPLIVVNLPLNLDYLDSVRMSSERQFRQQMQSMASQRGFIFRDFGELWPNQDDYFADPSHLNRYGAFAVALELASDRSIPWSKGR